MQPIPPRVIQLWGGGGELPPLCRAAMQTIKVTNPSFEHVVFDDGGMNQFVQREFPDYLELFRSFPLAVHRYDFFRYLAIYRLGGFYFDTDVFLAAPLCDLLPRRCVFTFEALTTNPFLREEYGLDWEVANYAFGAAAGHPFIGSIVENCVRARKDPEWALQMMRGTPAMFRQELSVLYTTGPWLVTRTLAEYPDASEVHVLFPDDVLDQANWNLFGSYGVHLMQGQWRSGTRSVRRRLLRAWRSWRWGSLIQQSSSYGKTRSLPAIIQRAGSRQVLAPGLRQLS